MDCVLEQIAGVPATDMVALPKGIANHPAWVSGHLTHACQLLGGVIGLSPWLPPGWEDQFGTGSIPVADVNAYESKQSLLKISRDAITAS